MKKILILILIAIMTFDCLMMLGYVFDSNMDKFTCFFVLICVTKTYFYALEFLIRILNIKKQ